MYFKLTTIFFVRFIPAIAKSITLLVMWNTLSVGTCELLLGTRFVWAIELILSALTVGSAIADPAFQDAVGVAALELTPWEASNGRRS